ncbi:hypothetical protein GPECTOR_30g255 [Gonium pectorale]|uniref:Uncharacterized protein n=1 Tax=Gonium pectorale TaxID=33097 RepID=A0A150GE96_GONPE|nr:hypothetical protein GPECTOR_30g255 [Gonium pectorale]|eukprot:KXZ48159.1 hypothetical protein GPECTOR_30g255 [Gonium pectorale]
MEGSAQPHRRKYRPLDVRTWFEGFLRLIGWILVIVLAVVTGGTFMGYELKILNRHDTDFRDLYFDQRITSDLNNRYHKNFLLADGCCNPDPVIFPYTCDESLADTLYDGPPYCKPLVVIECSDVRSAACNSTREVLYDAAGLPLTAGLPYTDCVRAGRVRVGATVVAAGRPITLVAYYQSRPTGAALVIQSPFSINASQVREFVAAVATSVGASEANYVQPSTRLSSAVTLGGSPVSASLELLRGGARGLRAPPPWKLGTADVAIPLFSLASPDDGVIPLAVAGSELLLAAWRVAPLQPSDPDVVGGLVAAGQAQVDVGFLSEVQATVGQVPLLGACGGWQLSTDPADLKLSYSSVWTGKLAELQAGMLLGPFRQTVKVGIRDVGGPRRIALPSYGGMWYIFNAFCMACIWLFSNSLILFVIILVWWNIRSNKGLPPIIYRYMKRYRGW